MNTPSANPVTSPHRLVSEVFARYVRAADRRDPDGMAAVFADDATVAVYYRGDGEPQPLAELTGAITIGSAVTTALTPHPPRGWSHHTTANPIVTVTGDRAHFDAQFLVYDARGSARPESGWPDGASGAQGVITPIECGYLTADLVLREGEWRISGGVRRGALVRCSVHDRSMSEP